MERELIITSDKPIDKFMNNVVVKGLIQLIPWAGPCISEIISNKENKFVQDRIIFFLENLYLEIRALKDVTPEKWLESEEYYDLFNLALESSLQNRSREKILMNVRILSVALRDGVEQSEFAEEFLYSLKDLSPLEVKALAAIYTAFNTTGVTDKGNDLESSIKAKWREMLIEKCGIDGGDIDFVVKRLETTGLISEITGTFFDYSGGEIKINKTFNKLIKHIHSI